MPSIEWTCPNTIWHPEVFPGRACLEHVDFLDAGDVVDGELLERRLELLVVGGGRAVDHLLLPAHGAWAADAHLRLKPCQFFRVHPGKQEKNSKTKIPILNAVGRDIKLKNASNLLFFFH